MSTPTGYPWIAEIDDDFPYEDDDIDFDEDYYDDETLPPTDTFVREERKIGRNEPCPCDSGKKYKKCCMKKDRGLDWRG